MSIPVIPAMIQKEMPTAIARPMISAPSLNLTVLLYSWLARATSDFIDSSAIRMMFIRASPARLNAASPSVFESDSVCSRVARRDSPRISSLLWHHYADLTPNA
jgi:hypothetical protein